MLKLSLIMTMRDWRAGELRFLLGALALAVASLSAVQFFADRMKAALERDAHQLLGADLRVVAQAPMAAAWREEAQRLGLASATTVELPSMAIAGEGDSAISQMVLLKAVSAGYPLRGSLSVQAGATATPTLEVPAPGTAWVDPSLLASLKLRPGQTIRLGERSMVVAQVIAAEPDRGPAALMFSPRVMIAVADLDSTGLVQTGAMASWNLLLAGDSHALGAYQAWGKVALAAPGGKGMEIDTLATSSAATSDALGRANTFLSVIGLLSALLASVAVAMAARRFMLRHADACAMLRCLGMAHRRVIALFMIEFLIVGVCASMLGVALGFAGHFVLLESIGTLATADLAPVSLMPALHGLAVGVLLLAGFGLPPLLQLRDIPHNRLLRRESAPPQARTVATYALGLLMFGALLAWQAADLVTGLLTAGSFMLGLMLFGAVGWAALAALRFVPRSVDTGVMRLALADMRRRPAATVTQVVALALGLMALLLMTVVRGDLLASWHDTAPLDAPNHVVYNLQPDQLDAVAARLRPFGQPAMHPLMRGRLLHVNGKDPKAADAEDKLARRLIDHEIDVSSAQSVPPSNTVVAGRWFGNAGGVPELSLSEISAKSLGVKLGDKLTLEFAGTPLVLVVTSLRKVDWRSRRANFGMLIDPAAAQGLARTYVTALYVPAGDSGFVNRLVSDYPNLTVMNTGAMIAQFQGMLDQVSGAVEFLFLFTLASGLLVLYATLVASQDERQRQAAILRALGASRAQLARAQWIEYALTGSLAGLLAAAGASAGGWALARFAFKLEWHFSPALWAVGMAAGAACALIGSWAGLRAILNQAPLHSLRTH